MIPETPDAIMGSHVQIQHFKTWLQTSFKIIKTEKPTKTKNYLN